MNLRLEKTASNLLSTRDTSESHSCETDSGRGLWDRRSSRRSPSLPDSLWAHGDAQTRAESPPNPRLARSPFVCLPSPLRFENTQKNKPILEKMAGSRWRRCPAPFTCLLFSHWKAVVYELREQRGSIQTEFSRPGSPSHI